MNKLFIFLLFVSAFLFSCVEEEEKTYLSDDQFTKMLFDIHLTDGMLTAQNIVSRGKEYRPSFYYNSIYKKYNITAEQFDSCVNFYTQNSELYEKMYEKIIDSLNRLETQFRMDLKDSLIVRDTVNLWKGPERFNLSRGRRGNLSFSVPVSERGIYTIQAKIKRYNNDQTEEPLLTAYFWKQDSSLKSQMIYFDSIPINRSDDFVLYQTQLEYPDTTFKELRGNIISWRNVDSNFTQHIDLKSIMIYNPQIKRDSLELDSIVRSKGRRPYGERGYGEPARPKRYKNKGRE